MYYNVNHLLLLRWWLLIQRAHTTYSCIMTISTDYLTDIVTLYRKYTPLGAMDAVSTFQHRYILIIYHLVHTQQHSHLHFKGNVYCLHAQSEYAVCPLQHFCISRIMNSAASRGRSSSSKVLGFLSTVLQ